MSYILDALKKADRDRHQAGVPTPATVHRTPGPPLRRRRLWPWIVGAVIVVNAGVWLWLLRPAPSVSLSQLEHNPDMAPRVATKPAHAPSAGAAAPRSAVPPKSEPETAQEKAPASATDSAPVKPLEQDPVTPPASQEPSSPEKVVANLHLQVHVYSEVPAERRVFINNYKYVEGQRIDANLVIESITPDGVFVSYQGKRVLLRAD